MKKLLFLLAPAIYDKLAAGKSVQKLSKAQAAEFSPAKKLSPTHYALKIYPRNEEEQWRVEKMEDVQVAYIPFSFAQLTAEEAGKVERSKTRSAANTFSEKSPYTVTYDYSDATDGGSTAPVTYQLPILYAVWPASKPLPDDLEYEVDYEVFLPYKKPVISLSMETMRALTNEAVSFARVLTKKGNNGDDDPTDFVDAPIISGLVTAYDNSFNGNVPMVGLRVTFTDGSFVVGTNVLTNGRYYLSLPYERVLPPTITGSLSFSSTDFDWKVTSSNSTVPVSFSSQWIDVPMPSNGDYYLDVEIPTNNQIARIHRAANYYFNHQTDFPRHSPSGGVRIISHSTPGDSNGSYSPSNKTINVYPFSNYCGHIIGTTLHEIGHLVHHLNNQSHYNGTHAFIKEAFSSYVGWYEGEAYYMSLNWTKPPRESYITGEQGRQTTWAKNDAYHYSPLFVDLTDNYNQGTNNASRPNDNIQSVQPSVVWSIITTSQNWTGCRNKLQSYAGTGAGKLYSSVQFDLWIDAFDDWVDVYY